MFASFTDPMAGLICTARRLSEFVFYKAIRPNGGSRMVRNVRKVPRMVHDVQRHRGYKQHAE